MKTCAGLHGNMQMQGIKSPCGNTSEAVTAGLDAVSGALCTSGGSSKVDISDKLVKGSTFNLDIRDLMGEPFAPLRSNPHRSPG